MINVLWASGKKEKWYHELSEWQAIMSDMVSKTKMYVETFPRFEYKYW